MKEKELSILKQMLQLSDTQQRQFLTQKANQNFLKFISECFLNVYQGKVPINKQYIEKYEKPFQMILNSKSSYQTRRKIFAKNLKLVQKVTISSARYLKSL